jgi:hypothetical protein
MRDYQPASAGDPGRRLVVETSSGLASATSAALAGLSEAGIAPAGERRAF